MTHWFERSFEVDAGNGYLEFVLMDDNSLEIALSDGVLRENWRDGRMETRVDELTISAEDVPSFLVGLQAWIEQL